MRGAGTASTVHVFDTMGTTVSVRIDGTAAASSHAALLGLVESVFAAYDERFSLYRRDSPISRVARGELALTDSDEDFRELYAEALAWRSRTDDAFTPHRPDGVLDLSGLVKARATDAAGRLLQAAGIADFSLNAGGDVITSGAPAGAAAWATGIVDPDDRAALLGAVPLGAVRQALATSGTAERGEHVWRSDRQPAGVARFRQVSVAAADIVTADVLATAILAGGPTARDAATDRFDIDVLTVDLDGALTATAFFRAA